MIPRADFGAVDVDNAIDLLKDFPIQNLASDSPILKLLRKPDFQRETNHWSPEQLVSLIESFLDNEVIPSLIFWNNPTHIFVIDGGHRLSALRAWIEDDYGDKSLSLAFYGGEISDDQRRTAKRTRQLIETRIGRFEHLKKLVDSQGTDRETKRAKLLFKRALTLQWVQGTPDVAETSFYKINSQGTPLDEIERLLIEHRRKPIAIGARAIFRGGGGHKYWSRFEDKTRKQIEDFAEKLHDLLFEPEQEPPIKTLDVPLGGSVSPVDALAMLIEFLTIAANRHQEPQTIAGYVDDESGDSTVTALKNTFQVLNRMSGNDPASLGLHPAVYFYNEKGKYSRFLFLGMAQLLTDAIRNNNSAFFKTFTKARAKMEKFLVDNKSVVGVLPQNLARSQRIPKMRDMFDYLVKQCAAGEDVTPEMVAQNIGLRGRILDITAITSSPQISDDTKSMVFLREGLKAALRCPVCGGYLDPRKSVHYDHIKRREEGGTGDASNTQLAHPYCNSGYKESQAK